MPTPAKPTCLHETEQTVIIRTAKELKATLVSLGI